MSALSRLLLLAAVGASLCCSASSPSDAASAEEALGAPPARDWAKHPAIVVIDEADEIYALSDPHGGYEELGRLLTTNSLVSGFSSDPSSAKSVHWTGGSAILVVAGDLIDKGIESVGVIDLLRALEEQAPASGGRVVVTMGNHEAEFLADPMNDKATSTKPGELGIDVSLKKLGIDPKKLARGKDAEGRGDWLLGLPFGVKIKKWFFAHGGNTDGDSVAKLEKRLEKAIDTKGYDDKDITGKDSILEAQQWYEHAKHDPSARKNADALGVKHIVFGHDPGALNDRGHILASDDRTLVKLDVNMGLGAQSKAHVGGLLLHIRTKGTDTAEVLDEGGLEQSLF